MAAELLLGETIVNRGGTTIVPKGVIEGLWPKPKSGERCKLLWTLEGGEVTVTKGTAQSDWRKTMLRRNGTAAIPRHIQQGLNLRTTAIGGERVLWVRKGNQIVVRKVTRT